MADKFVGEARAAAIWYSNLLGVAVEAADVLKDDEYGSACNQKVDGDLCLRQSGHWGEHVPAIHVDPSGHRWRLRSTFLISDKRAD